MHLNYKVDVLREKVAVATVDGKAYFHIVNQLREQNLPFLSVIPGRPVPAEAKAVITTEKEKSLMENCKVLVFHDERDLDSLVIEVKRILQGKEAYEQIIIGIDPGGAIGLAAIADGRVIDGNNCYSKLELVSFILKIVRSVNFTQTSVIVKIGNGVPMYRELLEALDEALPLQVVLEVVSEAGTNKPQKKRSRKIRHISSAIRIAARSGLCIHGRDRWQQIFESDKTLDFE